MKDARKIFVREGNKAASLNARIAATAKYFFRQVKSFCLQHCKLHYHLLSYAPHRSKSYNTYTKELRRCIKNKSTKNIAVTGVNGSGKSSVIEQLKLSIPKWMPFWILSHKTIKMVSFLSVSGSSHSHIHRDISSKKEEDKTESGRAMPVDAEDGAVLYGSARQAIQWEIVKQLFFSIAPNKTPRSRYFRIGRTRWHITIVASLISGALLEMAIGIQKIYELTRSIIVAIVPHDDFFRGVRVWLQDLLYNDSSIFHFKDCTTVFHAFGILCFSLLSFIIIYEISKFCQDHPLKSLEIKDITLNFRDGVPDFEQMSDELIYLFKAAHIRIVILEDIDRFDDPLIYEDLRQLNTLLNNAIKHKITFIYALREDLIPKVEDRAKLFDVTMPIIPVMTSDNAVGIIKREFEKVGFCPDNILNMVKVISDNVCDMRSVKAICNGSLILRGLIQNTDIGQKLCDEEQMIAIATIREICSAEYQALCGNSTNATSVIDGIFMLCQKERDKKITIAESNLDKSRHMPELLSNYKDTVWEKLNTANSGKDNAKVVSIKMDSEKIEYEQVGKMDFVRSLLAGSVLHIMEEYRENYYTKTVNMDYRLSDIDRLISKEYGDLVRVAEFSTEFYEKQISQLNEENPFTEYEQLSVSRQKELPPNIDGIIDRIILEGILDQNYRLYITPFSIHSAHSASLINFEIGYLQKNIPNYEYRLSNADITILLNDYGYYLGTPVLHNYSIMSYVINISPDKLDAVLAPRKGGVEPLTNFLIKWLLHQREKIAQSILLNQITVTDYVSEPSLVFLSKMSQRYFLATISSLVSEAELSDSVKNFILTIALLSAPNFRKDDSYTKNMDNDVLHSLDIKSSNLVVHNGIGDILAELFRINCYKVEHLAVYDPASQKTIDLLQGLNFKFTPTNLRWLHENNFDDVIASYKLTRSELEELIASPSSFLHDVRKIILSNVRQYGGLIKNDKALADRVSIIILKNKLNIKYDDQLLLAGNIPDNNMIKILLLNKNMYTPTTIREILRKMSEPYKRLAKPKAKPTLPDDKDSLELIKLLEELNMIYPPKSLRLNKVVVKDFQDTPCDER